MLCRFPALLRLLLQLHRTYSSAIRAKPDPVRSYASHNPDCGVRCCRGWTGGSPPSVPKNPIIQRISGNTNPGRGIMVLGSLSICQRRLGRRIFVMIGLKARHHKPLRTITCRAQSPDIPRAGRCGAAHCGAAGQGGTGQDGTPTGRSVQETPDPLAFQGIENNCPEHPPGSMNKRNHM